MQNEFICQVLETCNEFEVVSSLYPEYTWMDFSEYFVNPGIIDLNVCLNNEYYVGDDDTLEFEGNDLSESSSGLTCSLSEISDPYETGTKLAAAGGVTFVIENPQITSKELTPKELQKMKYQTSQKSLFCDLSFLAMISNDNLDDVQEFSNIGIAGFKSFLIPPGMNTPFLTVERIKKALESVSRINKPIFFHPEKANERYLYMSSPFRNETLGDRINKPEPAFAAFPAAFPEEIDGSSSEISPISSTNSTPLRFTPVSAQQKADEKLLERQIIYQSNNLESLIKAEIMTYSTSGFTFFDPTSPIDPIKPIPEISQFNLKLNPAPLFCNKSPIKAVSFETKPKRPPPIFCSRPVLLKENTDYKLFLANCPPHWEVNGVQAIITELKKVPRAQVHITNLSSATAIYAIRKHKKEEKSLNLTCETAAFYLYFSDDHIKPGDTRFKACPPIREEKNRKLMLEILAVDGIDVVSSYHRPVRSCMKFLGAGDFKRALSGVYAIGWGLQTLWECIGGDPRVTACKIAKLMSEAPADVLGIVEKGRIVEGKHADLVVWDPFGFAEGGRNQMNPFLGEKMKGKVVCTIVRGKVVFSNGCFWPHGRVV